MTTQILAATTSAVASTSFIVGGRSDQDGRATISVIGIAGAENADIQFSHDVGTTWTDLFQDGSQVRLTATNNMVTVYGPGLFRVDKEATAGATSIHLHKDVDP